MSADSLCLGGGSSIVPVLLTPLPSKLHSSVPWLAQVSSNAIALSLPGHPVHTHVHKNIHNTNCTLVVIYARCGYLACFSCYRCVFHQLSLSFLYGEYHSFCLLSLPFNTFKGPLVASVYCIGGVFPPYICIYIHDLYCTCGVVWCVLTRLGVRYLLSLML